MAAGFMPICLAVRRELRDGQARELFYVLLMRPNSGIVNLLDLPSPGHRAPPENALKIRNLDLVVQLFSGRMSLKLTMPAGPLLI
jgi:hypothetical protein